MNARGNPRLVDVAERAGVTISTASRALARPEMVRSETRERVLAAAEELGYEPNRAAQSLITGHSRVVAVVIPDLTNTYYALLARAAQNFARNRGYEVYIIDTGDDVEREREIVRSVARWADGIVVCSAQIQHIVGENLPIVYVNRRVRDSHAVLLDQHVIVETQVNHLVNLGHRDILWVAGPKAYWTSEIRRRHAVLQSVRYRGLRISEPMAADHDGGAEVVELLDPAITAVAAFNDRQALGILSRSAELGIRVPDDLSVVGADDVPDAGYAQPGLTTVHAPKEEMGRAAVSLLLDHLTNEGPVILETMRGHLVVRGSTGPPRAGAHFAEDDR